MTRPIVTKTIEHMECPSHALRTEANNHGGEAAYHDTALKEWPCLSSLECVQPARSATVGTRINVAAWNIERCKRVEDSAALLREAEADIVLATEVDIGMARSGQRHTTRDLAALLDMGYIYGTEFVELGTGDPYETSLFADVTNESGLHGNAILSRFPILQPALIPLDDGGLWFISQPKGDGQLRVGGRMAMSMIVETPAGPVAFCAAHYESESDPAMRGEATARLIESLSSLYGDTPCVIGGDLNTNRLMDGERLAGDVLARPQAIEPTFQAFEEADYDWRQSNTGQMTIRAAPGKPVRYPLQILDWLLVRGVSASSPQVFAAVSDAGNYLSDHELITCEITL